MEHNPLPRFLVAAPFAPLPSKERMAEPLRLRRKETAEKNEELADLTLMQRASVARVMVPFVPVKDTDDDGRLGGWVVASVLGSAWRNTRRDKDAAAEYRHGVLSTQDTLRKALELRLRGNCAGTAVDQEVHDILSVGEDEYQMGPGALSLAQDALTFMMKFAGVTRGEKYFRENPHRAGLKLCAGKRALDGFALKAMVLNMQRPAGWGQEVQFRGAFPPEARALVEIANVVEEGRMENLGARQRLHEAKLENCEGEIGLRRDIMEGELVLARKKRELVVMGKRLRERVSNKTKCANGSGGT